MRSGVSGHSHRWLPFVGLPFLALLTATASAADPWQATVAQGPEAAKSAAPTGPQTPQTPTPPPKEPAIQQPPEAQAPTTPDLSPSDETSAAVGGEGFASAAPGGYLDNAIPMTMFRMRYDAEFGINRFDRATFMFAAWKELQFHPHAVQGGGAFFDNVARGIEQLPKNVDLEFASAYGEYAFTNWFSTFVTVPFEYVSMHNLEEDHPEGGFPPGNINSVGLSQASIKALAAFGGTGEFKGFGILPANIQNLTGAARLAAIAQAYPGPGTPTNANPTAGLIFPEPRDENGTQHTTQEGLSDIDFGFKVALIADPDRYLTFQLRTYSPSGDAAEGIGTGHWTEEPSILAYQRMGCWEFQGQLQLWIPLTNDPVAGNVLNVGAGAGYEIYKRGKLRIVPITEWIMWEVLNGYESVFEPMNATAPPNLILPITHGVESARGVTIVNGKFGVRTYYGDHCDMYVGYGQAVTRERWYDDIVRVEFRYKF